MKLPGNSNEGAPLWVVISLLVIFGIAMFLLGYLVDQLEAQQFMEGDRILAVADTHHLNFRERIQFGLEAYVAPGYVFPACR
jgi:hypothetical protein